NSIRISSYTPKGIGYREFKKYGLLADSYFVSEKYEYDFTIREPLENSSFSDRENIFKAFVKFSYQLHNENVLHLDFSPGNILIKKENNTYVFKIVDINRMEFKSLSIDERILNLSKLWAKDSDMVFIAQEYALLLGINDNHFVEKALDNSHKHKRFKNFKRRLKGKRVVE
ncbi:MAG: hypothetical protein U9Q83_09240, partial [Bacteroidota bacterium]|nr:hypothetical protein [Bacteroidota bacterium]